MPRFNVSGLASVGARLEKIQNANYSRLMERWEQTVTRDNREGVLAGLDKDGQPLAAVTYRPIKSKPTIKRKNWKRDRGFKGFGPLASGLHGNLSTAEYRRLAGPPLAPRYANSRVITNLATRHGVQGGVWFVEAAWLDVVSTKGVPFLLAHFNGEGRLPRRDLRGVRPAGMERLREQLTLFFVRLIWRR